MKEAGNTPVLISVTDHIFTPEIVSILSRHAGNVDIVVATDPSPILVDVVKATKNKSNCGKVIVVGKNIEYDYIGMDLFIANKPWRITSMF